MGRLVTWFGARDLDALSIKREEQPDIPAAEGVRVLLMAFHGAVNGYGSCENLSKDKTEKYAIGASYELMMALMKKDEERRLRLAEACRHLTFH